MNRLFPLFTVLALFSSFVSANHFLEEEGPRHKAADLSWDDGLISEFKVYPNIADADRFPQDLPFDRPEIRPELVDLSKQKSLTEGWKKRIEMVKVVIREILQDIPEFKNELPMKIGVIGIRNHESYRFAYDYFTPHDFESLSYLRKKIVGAALRQKQESVRNGIYEQDQKAGGHTVLHYDPNIKGEKHVVASQHRITSGLRDTYALAKNPTPTNPYYPSPEFHLTKENAGKYVHEVLQAKEVAESDPETAKYILQYAKKRRLADMNEGMDPNYRYHPDAITRALHSLLLEYANKQSDPKIVEKWFQFAMDNIGNLKHHRYLLLSERKGSWLQAADLSLDSLLSEFQNTLGPEQSRVFEDLRKTYGLDSPKLQKDEAIRMFEAEESPAGATGHLADYLQPDGLKVRLTLHHKDLHGKVPDQIPQSENNLFELIESNSFKVVRGMTSYASRLPVSMLIELNQLPPDSRVIDMGSGEGIAMEEYLTHRFGKTMDPSQREYMAKSFPKTLSQLDKLGAKDPNDRAAALGITYKMIRPVPDLPKFKVLKDRFLEQIPDEEIGKAEMIWDVYGVFAYSPQLDTVFDKYLKALKPGRSAYIYAESPNVDRSTVTVDGRKTPLTDWLVGLNIEGMKFTHELSENNQKSLKLTKTGEPAKFPRLRLLRTDQEEPPTRHFEVVK